MISERFAVFFRHQASSIAATIVDFGTMILLVELAHFRPELATLVGAALGACTNFTLGRFWAFRAVASALGPQAGRYALVSGLSAGFNALGEHALVAGLGLPYVPSRVVIAVVVSVCWNFPAHKHFVFRSRTES